MPYAEPAQKAQVNAGGVPEKAGALCYQLTMLAIAGQPYDITKRMARQHFEAYASTQALVNGKASWQHYCDIMGATMGMAAELKRRNKIEFVVEQAKGIADALGLYYDEVIGPYEDQAIQRNGDIF